MPLQFHIQLLFDLLQTQRSGMVKKNCYSDHFCYPDSTNGSKQCPFLSGHTLLLPDSCPINVVSDCEKQVTGINPNPSILEYDPHPAIARAPKLINIRLYKYILQTAIIEFWIPAGIPFTTISRSIFPFIRSSRKDNRNASGSLRSFLIHRTALNICETIVAKLLHHTPNPKPPISTRSRITFRHAEMIR